MASDPITDSLFETRLVTAHGGDVAGSGAAVVGDVCGVLEEGFTACVVGRDGVGLSCAVECVV